MKAHAKFGENGTVENEAIVIFTFEGPEDQPKIRTAKEFSDVESYKDFVPKFEKILGENNP